MYISHNLKQGDALGNVFLFRGFCRSALGTFLKFQHKEHSEHVLKPFAGASQKVNYLLSSELKFLKKTPGLQEAKHNGCAIREVSNEKFLAVVIPGFDHSLFCIHRKQDPFKVSHPSCSSSSARKSCNPLRDTCKASSRFPLHFIFIYDT